MPPSAASEASTVAPCSTCRRVNCTSSAPACIVCCSRHSYERICAECGSRTYRHLRALPVLYRALKTTLEPGSSSTGQRVSGTQATPIPVRLVPLSLRAHGGIEGILTTWEDDWLFTRDLASAPARGSIESTVDASAAYLRTHWAWASDHHPAADEFARDIARCVSECVVTLALDSGDKRLPFECPACSAKALVRLNGAESIYCIRCHATEPYDRLPWIMRRFAVDAEDVLLTTRKVASVCEVGPWQITRWVDRDELAPAALMVKDQRPLYRLSDVLAVIDAKTSRHAEVSA